VIGNPDSLRASEHTSHFVYCRVNAAPTGQNSLLLQPIIWLLVDCQRRHHTPLIHCDGPWIPHIRRVDCMTLDQYGTASRARQTTQLREAHVFVQFLEGLSKRPAHIEYVIRLGLGLPS
jgi:hypothetical protein